MSDKVIVVTGATGQQGGSVVRSLLDDGGFRIRAVTRKTDSPKALELASKGVEVVKADLEDVESLKVAFAGAYGVFGLTNFWEAPMTEEKEIRQGKNLVDAAKATGVKHFVWSTLDHTKDPHTSHWSSKAVVDDYLKESRVPRTSLYTVAYFEAFVSGTLFPYTKAAEGKYVADWPLVWSDGKIGFYSVADTGAFVLAAFKDPQAWIGKDMRIVSDVATSRDIVGVVREVTGKDLTLKEVDRKSFEAARAFQEEIWCNNETFYKHDGLPNRDLELTKKIYPQAKSLKEWVEANKDSIVFPA